MIKLDDDLLKELGLASLPAEEKKKLLAHIYETLEMRVGMKLAEQMSEAQLKEFERFIETNDEGGALRWLETNFPNYKDVVAAEFDILKREIGQSAPQILAAAQQAQQQPVPGVMPMAPSQQWPQQPAPWPTPPTHNQHPAQGSWQTHPGQQPLGPAQYYNTPPVPVPPTHPNQPTTSV